MHLSSVQDRHVDVVRVHTSQQSSSRRPPARRQAAPRHPKADERWDAEFLEAHGWLVRTCLACIYGSSAELTMTLFADSTIQT